MAPLVVDGFALLDSDVHDVPLLKQQIGYTAELTHIAKECALYIRLELVLHALGSSNNRSCFFTSMIAWLRLGTFS